MSEVVLFLPDPECTCKSTFDAGLRAKWHENRVAEICG